MAQDAFRAARARRRAKVVVIDRREAAGEPDWPAWAEFQSPQEAQRGAEAPARGVLIGIAAGAVLWGVGWAVRWLLRLCI